MVQEEWKSIPGYEGLYEASSLGKIRSVDRTAWNGHKHHIAKGKILKVNYCGPMGYGNVALCRNGKPKTFRVHALVALTFHGARPEGLHVGHKDANPRNNAKDNLEYMTIQENMHQSYRDSGLGPNRNGLERVIEFNGKCQNLTQWSRDLGGKDNLVSDRLERGWTETEAITTPLGQRKPSRGLDGRYLRAPNNPICDMVPNRNGRIHD
jgi:hypothetical protein